MFKVELLTINFCRSARPKKWQKDKLTRQEALSISTEILKKAELERLEVAELEASKGLQYEI